MRLAHRGFLILALAYTVTIAGLVWGARAGLEQTADVLVEQTARLIGAEIVATMQEGLVEELRAGGAANRFEMLTTLQALTEHTGLVETVTVVDRHGEVFASDAFESIGREVETPQELFSDDPRARLVEMDVTASAETAYLLDIPLEHDGELLGYVHLGLREAPMSDLYAASRRRLVIFAAVGLVLVALLGLAFHLQLARSNRRLTAIFEDALRGDEVPEPDEWREFGDAIRAAGRLGQAIRTERQPRELADQRLRDLVDMVDVGVLQIALDRRVEHASHRARELLAPTLAGDDGEWTPLLSQLDEAFDRLESPTDDFQEIEVELVNGGGGRQLRAKIVPVVEDPCTGYTVIVRDQAALEAIETDLRLAARLRNMTSVYMGVAHDLRAPLNAIVLNLELLRQDLGDGLEAGQVDSVLDRLEVVEGELERLQRALDLLLAQARPDTSEPERFDLRDVVEEIRTLLEPQARQQTVTLESSLPDHPIVLHGVRDQIEQAILNVAINGLEATSDRGSLHLDLAGKDGVAALTVRDSGTGIPEEMRDKLFELHVTSKESGTGIGLFVAHSILTAHGATLGVVETGPEGTSFEIRFPMKTTALN